MFFRKKIEEKIDPVRNQTPQASANATRSHWISNGIDPSRPGYEEEERRTSKAGYLLLFIMFIAAVFFGWLAIDDLQNVPEKPEKFSSCASNFVIYKWEDFGRYGYDYRSYPAYEPYYSGPFGTEKPKCVFSSLEKKYGIPEIFTKREPTKEELDKLRQELNRATGGISESERQYNLGLQEKQAGVPKSLFPVPELGQNIESLRVEQQSLKSRIAELEVQLKPIDEKLKARYKDAMRDYRYAWKWYEFKVFLLEIIFVFPFFLFVFWMYRKMLAKNSPYAIIFTALVGVAAVLALRVFMVWFWSLFLARIIEIIWTFILKYFNFGLLKSLVFYGGMVLSIFLFGGAVYLLQKKIFDPRRVAIRRLRQKQCPNCQTSLDLSAGYCPNCGRKLKENCPQCGKERWADFHFCQYCRMEKTQ